MYLSRLTLNHSRTAYQWVSNPYRVHQRLKTACEDDPRLLFRIEEPETSDGGSICILVQSHSAPNWNYAFHDLPVLQESPETKSFSPHLSKGRKYHFRLLANPTIKKTVVREGEEPRKARLGIMRELDQKEWLRKKMGASGAELLGCMSSRREMQRSHRSQEKGEGHQVHLAVLFDGELLVKDSGLLIKAVVSGIGSAKGYGFGLLSLAPA